MYGKRKSMAVLSRLYEHITWNGGCGEARAICAGTLCAMPMCDAAIPRLATEGNIKSIELVNSCQPTEMLQQHSLDLDSTRTRTKLEPT